MKWPFVLRSTLEKERAGLLREIVKLRSELRDERATVYLTPETRAKLQAEVNESVSRLLSAITKNDKAMPRPQKLIRFKSDGDWQV